MPGAFCWVCQEGPTVYVCEESEQLCGALDKSADPDEVWEHAHAAFSNRDTRFFNDFHRHIFDPVLLRLEALAIREADKFWLSVVRLLFPR